MFKNVICVNPMDLMSIHGICIKDNKFMKLLQSNPSTDLDIIRNEYFQDYYRNCTWNKETQSYNDLFQYSPDIKFILERFHYLINLSEEIKHNGQDNIPPIEVYVNDDGKIVIYEGIHRTTCLAFHGYKKIYVRVKWRSPVWVKFVSECYSEYPSAGTIYNPINHPDFNHFNVSRENRINSIVEFLRQDRYLTIEEQKSSKYQNYTNRQLITPFHYFCDDTESGDTLKDYHLKGLDLGSHLGFHCHTLERHGAVMTGVEGQGQYFNRACYLNRVYGLTTKFLQLMINDFIRQSDETFDFCLLLSTFYDIYPKQEEKNLLVSWIKKHVKMIFIDTHERLSKADIMAAFEVDETKMVLVMRGRDEREIYAIKLGSVN